MPYLVWRIIIRRAEVSLHLKIIIMCADAQQIFKLHVVINDSIKSEAKCTWFVYFKQNVLSWGIDKFLQRNIILSFLKYMYFHLWSVKF